MAKAFELGPCACALKQFFQADFEFGPCPTHLARDLIDPPLDRFAQPKIVSMQGQNGLPANGVKDPFADLDLRRHDASILFAVLAIDMRAFNEVKPTKTFFVAQWHVGSILGNRGDIGLDHCPHKPVERLAEGVVILTPRTPVHEYQQIAGIEPDAAADLFAPVDLVHDLTDHIDQDILVVDCGLSLGARDHLEPFVIMFVTSNGHFGLF